MIREYGTNNIYVPKLKFKVTVCGQRSNYVLAVTQKSTKTNFIKLHRKIKHYERVFHT